jgi:hypothetical protein
LSRSKEKTRNELKEAIALARASLVTRSQSDLGLPKGVSPVSVGTYIKARNAFDTIVEDATILDALVDGLRGFVTTHKKHGKV